MIARGYQQYKQQSVLTMTQAEMLLLLYDECIKRLILAEKALDKNDFDTFEAAVQRTKDIITYLTNILNHEYEISQSLYRLYDYFQYELVRLQTGRKKEIIPELKSQIKELRDAFQQADKINAEHNAGNQR